jgi:acetoacetyl-CoA synthetase
MHEMHEVIWQPSQERVARTHLEHFRRQAPGQPADYQALWEWSVSDLSGFWRSVWDFCGVEPSREPRAALEHEQMPGTTWFPGARLNYAEHLLRRRDDVPALHATAEGRDDRTVSYAELARSVARVQASLRALGVEQGDRVAADLPNGVEAVVTFLAASSIGAIFSSTSPDFGVDGVLDRFGQIEPKILVTTDGYRYGGRSFPIGDTVRTVVNRLDSVEHVVVVDGLGTDLALERATLPWDQLDRGTATEPEFAQLPFDHPLYVLYSSGTTGRPKSIVHSTGGVLLQHLKEHVLHTDLRPGEDALSWYTTCGWMMWNWIVSGLACGVTVVLIDGSPAFPDLERLWHLVDRAGVTHFGTSPRYLASCRDAGLRPRDVADLSSLRSVMSTGAPLHPEQFDWVYDAVHPDVQLASISGGTDIVSVFAGGVPTLPVRRGELQARALGMAVEAWRDGQPVIGEQGELVCTRPFVSMPLGFWGDDDGSRYHDAYFADHPGVWTHGDYIEIRPEGGVVIYGRSDTTLNPGGVRIGTAELYRAVEPLDEIVDVLAVDRPTDGDTEIVLFVQLAEGVALDDDLRSTIRAVIREANTPRHVPKHIVAVDSIPYTRSGKKTEKAVRQLLRGQEPGNEHALVNPEALDDFRGVSFP